MAGDNPIYAMSSDIIPISVPPTNTSYVNVFQSCPDSPGFEQMDVTQTDTREQTDTLDREDSMQADTSETPDVSRSPRDTAVYHEAGDTVIPVGGISRSSSSNHDNAALASVVGCRNCYENVQNK